MASIFNQISRSTRPERGHDILESRKSRECKHFATRRLSNNLRCGLDPIHPGHPDVHEHYIGVQLQTLLNGFSSLRGFTQNLKSWLGIK